MCTLFAPPEKRDSLHVLLAFNAEVARIPDAVTEPLLGQMRLQWWRDSLEGIYSGDPPQHPIAQPLSAVVREHGLARDAVARMLDARELDLGVDRPGDLETLAAHARATAGTLGELSVAVLGVDDPPSRTAAADVGTALALVGLVRSLPIHRARGREFLPEGIERPVESLCETARALLDRARERRRSVDRAALPALLPAVFVAGYLRDLDRIGFDPSRIPPSHRGPRPGRLLSLVWHARRHRF